MSIKIRKYRNGGWEVDIGLRMPDGEVIRERIKAPVTSKTGVKAWADQRQAYL